MDGGPLAGAAVEVKGQWVPESRPIPGLFMQEPGEPRLPFVPVVSEYLRLVPHIANNPARMREETERCLLKLEEMSQACQQNPNRGKVSGAYVFNLVLVNKIYMSLKLHHMRLSNATVYALTQLSPNFPNDILGDKDNLLPPFNCDLEAANKEFQREILKRNDTFEELKNCDGVGYVKTS